MWLVFKQYNVRSSVSIGKFSGIDGRCSLPVRGKDLHYHSNLKASFKAHTPLYQLSFRQKSNFFNVLITVFFQIKFNFST